MFHLNLFSITASPEKIESPLNIWLTLLIVIVGYGLLYFYLWVNRTRLYDTPRLGEVAYFIQQEALARWGEREFSRRLLDFEQMVEGKLEKTLKVLATHPDNEIKRLGYCWLIRGGYGHKSVAWLWHELEKLESPAHECVESDLVRD